MHLYNSQHVYPFLAKKYYQGARRVAIFNYHDNFSIV